MPYRVCKIFEVESGHMLSKHPDRCRFPHGHSRRIEIVVSAESLDANDMVCDFKALKLAIGDFVDQFDHSLAVNSDDALTETLQSVAGARVIVFENVDPTTEVLARHIHDHLKTVFASGRTYCDERGNKYELRNDLKVERVRVWETSSSWAEYSG
ncbi:MAG: 6-carboxytetrahydropterin synthase [Planctomycetota bacterium]|nr:MAG: 6-carboxytetrahydropterin synthase [Planctomycetota bacterium]